MLTTGIRRGRLKVFGDDLRVLEERAGRRRCAPQDPGGGRVSGQVTGAPYLDVRVNREAAPLRDHVGAVQT